jgi:hypothetical protein
MGRWKQIVVGVDGSPASRTARWSQNRPKHYQNIHEVGFSASERGLDKGLKEFFNTLTPSPTFGDVCIENDRFRCLSSNCGKRRQ